MFPEVKPNRGTLRFSGKQNSLFIALPMHVDGITLNKRKNLKISIPLITLKGSRDGAVVRAFAGSVSYMG